MADCAWAAGTGQRFVKSEAPQEKPKYKETVTMPRFIEIRNPQLMSAGKKTEKNASELLDELLKH